MSERRLKPALPVQHAGLLTLVMGTAAVLPSIPDQLSAQVIFFCGAFALFALVGLANLRPPRGSCGLGLCCFYVSLALSLPIALWNDVTLAQWLRAAAPFVFLTAFFFVRTDSVQSCQTLVNAVHVASLVWLAKMVAVVLLGFQQLLSGEIHRLTYLTMDLTLPYGLLGFVLSLFNPEPRVARWRLLLLILFGAIIVGSGYRSQLLLAAAALIVYAHRLSAGKRLVLATAAVVLFSAAIMVLRESVFVTELGKRFAELSIELESSRAKEVEYALSQFAEAPAFGKGLGYQVPVEVTFYGDWALLARVVTQESVGYIHSVWAYMLMDLGIFGALAFSIFLLGGCVKHRRVLTRKSSDDVRRVAILSILAMALFFSVEASFRQIQSNLIVALLVAASVGRYSRGRT